MTWKLFTRYRWIEVILVWSCAAACGDDSGGPPPNMTAAGGTQSTGSAGMTNGSGGSSGSDGSAAGASMGGAPGASGTNGAGEAPGMDPELDVGGMLPVDGASGGAAGSGMDPACATGATDTDGDGTPDCVDGCAEDPNKLAAGVCGCGVLDSDIDFDGALDCAEMCPGDPAKTAPGACGCGLADIDSDDDGTLDCDDGCPFDDTHLVPGACGCGAEDTLELCLRHRYSFDGTGAVATDSAGDADGDIIGTTLTGNGALTLIGGVSDQYVNLPPKIISTLGANATIEAWVTWTGAGAPWQRVFDFGSSDQAAGLQGPTGVTYLFLTPSNTINGALRIAYTNSGPPTERVVNGPTPLLFTVQMHLGVVVDGAAQTLALYQNGALLGTAPTLDTSLALLNDVNNWLGRSQFVPDEEFQGVLNEVRIYSAARSATQVAADFEAGPDDLPEQ